MPGVISASDFIRETREDLSSPTTSNFVSRIPQCKETVQKLEEALIKDREDLNKFKSVVKDLNKSGTSHCNAGADLSKCLNKMGDVAFVREDESDDITTVFSKFAVVTKELAHHLKSLMKDLDSLVLSPTDTLLGDMRGTKKDLRAPFDRAWKDYQDKFSELERQKKRAAKEAGMHRTELTASDIAELEKERKGLQLTTTDYLLKVNEIRTKKGVDLLENLLKFYQSQVKYFQDGLQTVQHFGRSFEDLAGKLQSVRVHQQEERHDLIEVSNALKAQSRFFSKSGSGSNVINTMMSSSLHSSSSAGGLYALHQSKGDASKGCDKNGYLKKRSEQMFRGKWQKRRCRVDRGCLEIFHSDESKAPNRVELVTCDMKSVQDDRLCFDVFSFNRTYHFQADSEGDKEDWLSVLLNAKEKVLKELFDEGGGVANSSANESLRELQRTLVMFVRNLPGNSRCCDCGSTKDATWLSTNFGVIVCIECSGAHRGMGVHVSKIQSLTLDKIGTSQLLVARAMSNDGFNKVMEANVDAMDDDSGGGGGLVEKPTSTSSMEERKAYIQAKYIDRRYVAQCYANRTEVYMALEQAVEGHSLADLLQAFGEAAAHGVDLTDPLPTSDIGETLLHRAISTMPESRDSGQWLHLVDFIVQNSTSLDRQTREGNTPLHYCAIQNQCESMRLLLRSGANPGMENNNGKSPLSIAQDRGFHTCEEMLLHGLQRKRAMFENVQIDWRITPHENDGSTDFSEDELDDLNGYNNNNNVTRTPDRFQHGYGYHPGMGPSSNSLGRSRKPRLSLPPGQSYNGHPYGTLPANPSSYKQQKHAVISPRADGRSRVASPGSSRAAVASTQSAQKRSPSSTDSGHSSGAGGAMATPSGYRLAALPSASAGSKRQTGNVQHHTVFVQVGSKSAGHPGPSSTSESRDKRHQRTAATDQFATTGSFIAEESSPEACLMNASPTSGISARMMQRSTESLDSLSDESNHHRNRTPATRQHSSGRRCRALYDCTADNEDELTFEEDDVIVIVNEETEDENWMEGYLMARPTKRGLFPVSFVTMIPDHRQ